MKTITVVGGGFAGMTLALKLAERGFKVKLLEKSHRLGGLLNTEITPYGLAESAANALIRSEEAEKLFDQLKVQPVRPLKSAKKRFIFRDKPTQWPLRLTETFQLVAKVLTTLVLNRKKLRPHPRQTLESWGKDILGKPATSYLLGPAMQGIHANTLNNLSASLILGPLFLKKKRKKYQGLMTTEKGMQGLVDALENKLKELQVEVLLNHEDDIDHTQDPLVIATSATAASQILARRSPALSRLLENISMSSVVSANLFFKDAQKSYKGFGCLVPREFNFKTLGVLMNSYTFIGRDQTYNETWILSGQDHSIFELKDSEILALIAHERFQILKSKAPLLDYRIHRWKKALPCYNTDLEEIQSELEIESDREGIFLHGNYLSGIGLSKILDRSEYLAQKIAGLHG